MKKVSEAVILAGGKGTRLRSVTLNEIPKGLAEIQEKPILQWEFEWLRREGVKHVVLAVGHLANKINAYFGNQLSTQFGDISISYSIEKEKLGSGGAFKQASKQITSDRCYVVNGDILTNARLEQMKRIHTKNDVSATMFLVKMQSPYGVVKFEGDLISNFVEKPVLDVYIHGGINIIENEVFKRFPDKGQMEDTIFVELANEKRYGSFRAKDSIFWESIDTQKDFENANKKWPGL